MGFHSIDQSSVSKAGRVGVWLQILLTIILPIHSPATRAPTMQQLKLHQNLSPAVHVWIDSAFTRMPQYL